MLSPLRIFLFTSLFLSSISAAVIGQQPAATEQQDAEAQSDLKTFQKLLEHVDPSALHAALHDLSEGKFQHGVFPEDRTAAEAVHRDNAPLATSIVSLARRQDSNSSIPIATVTSVVTVTETTSTSVIVVVSTSGVPASPSAPSTAITPSTQVPPPPSTTPGVPPPSNTPGVPPASSTVVVAITSTVPVVVSTTAAVPPVSVGPGPVSLSKTLLTTTNARGVTVVSTVNGGVVTLSLPSQPAGSAPAGATTTAAAPSSITTVVFQTTTLPNGAQSTITAVTVIQASESAIITPSGTAGVGAPGTSTTTPGLQSGLAPQPRAWPWELVGALGGAIGVAMIL